MVALPQTSFRDPAAQQLHAAIDVALPAMTNLPPLQLVQRRGCAMRPRGEAYHMAQPKQVFHVVRKELPDTFSCRCHHRFPNEEQARRRRLASDHVYAATPHGERRKVDKFPSSPRPSWACAENGGINLKELAVDYSTAGTAMRLPSRKLIKCS